MKRIAIAPSAGAQPARRLSPGSASGPPSFDSCRVMRRASGRAARGPAASVHCGTQLTFQADDHPDEVDITTCSLDHPEAVPPRDHTHTSSKAQWIRLTDGLAQYAQARPNA